MWEIYWFNEIFISQYKFLGLNIFALREGRATSWTDWWASRVSWPQTSSGMPLLCAQVESNGSICQRTSPKECKLPAESRKWPRYRHLVPASPGDRSGLALLERHPLAPPWRSSWTGLVCRQPSTQSSARQLSHCQTTALVLKSASPSLPWQHLSRLYFSEPFPCKPLITFGLNSSWLSQWTSFSFWIYFFPSFHSLLP